MKHSVVIAIVFATIAVVVACNSNNGPTGGVWKARLRPAPANRDGDARRRRV